MSALVPMQVELTPQQQTQLQMQRMQQHQMQQQQAMQLAFMQGMAQVQQQNQAQAMQRVMMHHQMIQAGRSNPNQYVQTVNAAPLSKGVNGNALAFVAVLGFFAIIALGLLLTSVSSDDHSVNQQAGDGYELTAHGQ